MSEETMNRKIFQSTITYFKSSNCFERLLIVQLSPFHFTEGRRENSGILFGFFMLFNYM